MKDIELKIPNLGEAEDTEIIEISVKKGDKLSKNDPIIVLESEKAAMEVPSDFDGKIKDIKVKEGDSVREGTVFAVIEVEDNEEPKQDRWVQVSACKTQRPDGWCFGVGGYHWGFRSSAVLVRCRTAVLRFVSSVPILRA